MLLWSRRFESMGGALAEIPGGPDRIVPDGSGARIIDGREVMLCRWPELATTLEAAPAASRIILDGAFIDLELGGGRFYHGDGRTIAMSQVEAFLASPARLILSYHGDGSDTAFSPQQARLATALATHCRMLGIEPESLPPHPVFEDKLLVVFGIGLGFHIHALVDRLRPQELIVVESEGEFLKHSLAAIDWPGLITGIEAGGGRVRLILDQDASRIASTILVALGAMDGPLTDGAFLFEHYTNPVLAQAAALVRSQAHLQFVARGFFEDELVMLTNTIVNLSASIRPLLGAERRRLRCETALIVAAGPSLDRDLAEVRRLRSGAVVFSCGTALRVCLKNGIVPDYHCESENVQHVFRILDEARTSFGLDGITLVASTTVDPRVLGLFSESILYFRESSISTRMFAAPGQEHPYATPLSANAAATAAISLGFTTLLLFGVDCGTTKAGCRHATGTAYQIFEDMIQEEATLAMEMTVLANFGGIATTTPTLDWSRIKLGLLFTRSGVKAFNCSDGAVITGATPQAATELETRPPLDRQKVKDELRTDLLRSTPCRRALPSITREIAAYFATVAAALSEDAPSIGAAWSALRKASAGKTPPTFHRSAPLYAGTARTLFEIGAWYTERMPEPAQRRVMLRYVLKQLADSIATATREADAPWLRLKADHLAAEGCVLVGEVGIDRCRSARS